MHVPPLPPEIADTVNEAIRSLTQYGNVLCSEDLMKRLGYHRTNYAREQVRQYVTLSLGWIVIQRRRRQNRIIWRIPRQWRGNRNP